MKKAPRKVLIIVAIAIVAALAWHFGLFRAGDCLIQGGGWNWDNGFCRLDSMPARGIG